MLQASHLGHPPGRGEGTVRLVTGFLQGDGQQPPDPTQLSAWMEATGKPGEGKLLGCEESGEG